MSPEEQAAIARLEVEHTKPYYGISVLRMIGYVIVALVIGGIHPSLGLAVLVVPIYKTFVTGWNRQRQTARDRKIAGY